MWVRRWSPSGAMRLLANQVEDDVVIVLADLWPFGFCEWRGRLEDWLGALFRRHGLAGWTREDEGGRGRTRDVDAVSMCLLYGDSHADALCAMACEDV